MQEGADSVSQTGNRVYHTLDHAGNPVDQPLDEIFPPLERLPRQSGDKPDGGRKSIGDHGIQPGKGRADPGDHPLEGGHRRFTQCGCDIFNFLLPKVFSYVMISILKKQNSYGK